MAFTRTGTVSHAALSGVAATQHHTATVASDLNLADLAARAHADLSDAPADSHHAKYTDAEAVTAVVVRSTVITGTRTAAAASGDVNYTGAGFVPTVAVIIAVNTENKDSISMGFGDDGLGDRAIRVFTMNGTHDMGVVAKFVDIIAGSDAQHAVLKSFDADGLTLTWTKDANGEACAFEILLLR